MEKFIARLEQNYPQLTFTADDMNYWSPTEKTIFYISKTDERAMASVLHELSHALLGHQNYGNDLELLNKEVAAWQNALDLSAEYEISISNEHIQDCLDTYREWLHRRSTCPTCKSSGLQITENIYTCINCHQEWKVSRSRLYRPYRQCIKTGT